MEWTDKLALCGAAAWMVAGPALAGVGCWWPLYCLAGLLGALALYDRARW